MQDRMPEVLASGSVALFRGRLVATYPMHVFSLYSHIQIGIEIVLDTGTETEL